MSDTREERMEARAIDRAAERRAEIDRAGNYSANNPSIDWDDDEEA